MKERLDVLLVKRNLAESREKAKAIIMSGNVFVEDQREDKAGTTFPEDVKIEVRGHVMPYVSRGGLKLEKAIKNFDVSVEGKVCTDVGSSTGGFTDCMLQNGAVKVYAVDVGYGQFAWKLRQDERVVCMEKTNIRYVVPEDLEGPAAFSSIDVSFISLTKVLLPVRNLLTEDGEIVCLIKPQFEAGRSDVGKNGIVRSKNVHVRVLRTVCMALEQQGLHIQYLCPSPIRGGSGNIEYLVQVQRGNVSPVPYAPEAVAEHAMALALTANRHTHKAYIKVRENNYSLNGLMGVNFYKKTAGIVGTGKIGAAMARICHGFGMRVLGYDMYPNKDLDFVEYVDLDTLLSQSDLISLHCPLMEETHHMINIDTIQKMKDGVILVNTSRGGLIKTDDLIQGIRENKFFAVGLDVYEEENGSVYEDMSETILEHSTVARLLSFPNVMVTSHQAFFTEEALAAISEVTLDNAMSYLKGTPNGNEL